jgi:alpha-glucosidase
MQASDEAYLWWQKSIVYEVYVRSFMDSNGDGIGDLQGILSKLDYLLWLGIKAIWLTPVYPSPMKDFGYDVADYKGIHPQYGTMQDFDELLKAVHDRDMKLIMDLVPNHTSDEHPWFLASRSSKDNPRRNWYIWHDAKPDGTPPNNWISVFGGSAWEWDAHTQQYYLHSFLKGQPDLNFRNKEVQEAVFEVMRFWLDKGIDGFRVDSIAHLIKDNLLRDNPYNPDYNPGMPVSQQMVQLFSTNRPEVHDVIDSMREVLNEYKDKVMIGELYLSVSGITSYYGRNNKGVQLPANFQLITDSWKAQRLSVVIAKSEALVPQSAWPHWAMGNHDQPRVISRIGRSLAKVAALLLLTLRGTPTMYYGDEIGMHNVNIPVGEMKDPQGLMEPEKNFSRDPQRTPMQWSSEVQAGFTSGKPWLPVAANYTVINVATEQQDDDSLLMLYQRLISLRRKEPSLSTGEYFPLFANEEMLAYIRQQEGADRFLIVLNISKVRSYYVQDNIQLSGMVELSTSKGREGKMVDAIIELEGGEGIIVRLNK